MKPRGVLYFGSDAGRWPASNGDLGKLGLSDAVAEEEDVESDTAKAAISLGKSPLCFGWKPRAKS
jgi:hypothetical protein